MSSAMIMSLVLTIHGFTCQTPTDDTVQWLKRNNQVFNNIFYTEKEISSLKDNWEETNSERVSVAVITEMKTFWTKLSPSVACPNDGYRNRRLSRDICSTCCSTVFTACAPITVQYEGQTYSVYHPSDGWQILFLGRCQEKSTCAYGKCQTEEDYHTNILVHDGSVAYIPKIKFIPVAYPRYCKCVNTS